MVQELISGPAFPRPATLRVRFRKTGNLQYISHLDLVRTMTRILLRAKIPVAYSEGFNPIPRLSFAAPLSVGVESEVEVMDVRITHPVDLSLVVDRLNKHLPLEMTVYDAYYAETKPNAIAYVSYLIKIKEAALPKEERRKAMEETLLGKPLTVVKNTKAGRRETDISPMVRSVETAIEGEEYFFRITLFTENASFLNPDYLVRALHEKNNALSGERDREHYTVLRTGFFLADGTPFR